MRLNSYICYVSIYPRNKNYKLVTTQTEFWMEIVRNLLNKAKHYDTKRQLKRVQEEEA